MSNLSKRSYPSWDELNKDYHANRKEYVHQQPPYRIGQRMWGSGVVDYAARRLWHNLWLLKNSNSGLFWRPTHKRTMKHFKQKEVHDDR